MKFIRCFAALLAVGGLICTTTVFTACAADGVISTQGDVTGERLVNGALNMWREGKPVGWQITNCYEGSGLRTEGKALLFGAKGSCSQKVRLTAARPRSTRTAIVPSATSPMLPGKTPRPRSPEPRRPRPTNPNAPADWTPRPRCSKSRASR
jgi:hypothetical protein